MFSVSVSLFLLLVSQNVTLYPLRTPLIDSGGGGVQRRKIVDELLEVAVRTFGGAEGTERERARDSPLYTLHI